MFWILVDDATEGAEFLAELLKKVPIAIDTPAKVKISFQALCNTIVFLCMNLQYKRQDFKVKQIVDTINSPAWSKYLTNPKFPQLKTVWPLHSCDFVVSCLLMRCHCIIVAFVSGV